MKPHTGPAGHVDKHTIDAAQLAAGHAGFGSRPLYVYEDAHRIVYAEALRTLLAQPGLDLAPDAPGCADHIAGNTRASARTLYTRIRKVATGSRLQLADGALRVVPPSAVRRRDAAIDETLAEFDLLLGQAVRRTLDAGRDAPAALLLSGGLWSSAVASYARRDGIALVAHGAGLADGTGFDAAHAVGRHLGLDVVEHTLADDALAAGVADWLAERDAPGAEPGDLVPWLLARRLQDAGGANTVLCGEPLWLAGDEATATASDARPWLRDKSRGGSAPAMSVIGLPGLAQLPACTPYDDADLTRFVAALDPAHAPRRLLQQLLNERLPRTVLDRAPARLSLPLAPLLLPLRGRLRAALAALRATPVADVLDLDAIGERIGGYFADPAAGGAASAALVWRFASLLLWWAEIDPATRSAQSAVSAQPEPAVSITTRQRLVVYTALIGPKEKLANPLAELPGGATSDLELDFVCVTDNPALTSDVWRFVLIPSGHIPPEKLSRRPKALPHDYFPDATHSLYIDNTVTFKRLPQASDLATERPYLFKAYRHATRDNPEQEAAAVASLGYDDVGTICNQMAFYAARRPLDTITPLTTATVLLRAHRQPEVQRFGTVWWESVLAFSKRDQLSFDFALQESGCAVEYFEGHTHSNDWIRWQGSLSQHRVKASFDSQRYAWLHRDDADARRDPKSHFLAHGGNAANGDAAYQKRAPLLELVCQMQQSSLGALVSPRRAMSEALETLISEHRAAGQRYVLARVVDSSAAHAFDSAEHDAAARALSMYLSPARGTLIDLPAAELVADGKVYSTDQPRYDCVIVLGATGAQLGALLNKLQPLLNPEGGSFVAALTEPATLAEAADAEGWLVHTFSADVRTALQGSLHDDQREPLPNTVLGMRWQRNTVPVATVASAAGA